LTARRASAWASSAWLQRASASTHNGPGSNFVRLEPAVAGHWRSRFGALAFADVLRKRSRRAGRDGAAFYVSSSTSAQRRRSRPQRPSSACAGLGTRGRVTPARFRDALRPLAHCASSSPRSRFACSRVAASADSTHISARPLLTWRRRHGPVRSARPLEPARATLQLLGRGRVLPVRRVDALRLG